MIMSRSDPYGLRGMVRPGRAEERGDPRAHAVRDKPENVRRCQTCTVPAELCTGLCQSDADQEQARQGSSRRQVDTGEILRMAEAGATRKAIAARLGIGVSTVTRAMKKYREEGGRVPGSGSQKD